MICSLVAGGFCQNCSGTEVCPPSTHSGPSITTVYLLKGRFNVPECFQSWFKTSHLLLCLVVPDQLHRLTNWLSRQCWSDMNQDSVTAFTISRLQSFQKYISVYCFVVGREHSWLGHNFVPAWNLTTHQPNMLLRASFPEGPGAFYPAPAYDAPNAKLTSDLSESLTTNRNWLGMQVCVSHALELQNLCSKINYVSAQTCNLCCKMTLHPHTSNLNSRN